MFINRMFYPGLQAGSRQFHYPLQLFLTVVFLCTGLIMSLYLKDPLLKELGKGATLMIALYLLKLTSNSKSQIHEDIKI